VFNGPGGNTIAAAELTMALMVSLVRNVTGAERSVREGRWDRASFRGSELRGKALGLIGAGRIGCEVALRAQAFGMSVLVYDPYLLAERAAEHGVDLVELDEVIGASSVIWMHVPRSDETRGPIDRSLWRAMKNRAFIINASRGGVIAETALAEALL